MNRIRVHAGLSAAYCDLINPGNPKVSYSRNVLKNVKSNPFLSFHVETEGTNYS